MATITFTTLRCLRQQDVTGKDEPVLFFEGDRIWNGVVDKKQTVRVDRTRAFDGSVTVTLKEENPRSLKTLGSVTIRRGDRGPAVFKTSGAHYELQYSITASTRGQMP